MSEIINTFSLKNPSQMIPMNRKDFYDEQVKVYKEEGNPSKAVEVVNVLLFNSHGELIIQKRSFDKSHNAGLLDKSIGGHIENGNTPDYTVMMETIQELQTPSIVLKDKEEFDKTLILMNKYLETVSVIYNIKTDTKLLVKIIDEKKIEIANKIHLYLGVYDGRIRPADREAKGVLFYSLIELEKEMIKSPDTFTSDLHFLINEYNKDIKEFVSKITQK